MTTVLVTGNQGYIGTNLSTFLVDKGYEVIGFDSGFYKDCNLNEIRNEVTTIQKDIRDAEVSDFTGVNIVIHLAALSNDPVGELDSKLTFEINYEAAVRVAEQAKKSGVTRFIFVSTQSIYGISDVDTELDEDASIKNPQTAYAKSKWKAEQEILSMSDQNFTATAVRPSTVFGWSPRLRSDIVFNNLLLNGLKKNLIEVHSDGSPWRPVIHVQDIANAILRVIETEKDQIAGIAFNLGVKNGNYTIRNLAEAARSCLGEIPIVYDTEKLTDSRSYKVSFRRASEILGFDAQIDLETGGEEIFRQSKKLFDEGIDLLDRRTIRLQQIKYLIDNNLINDSLRFK